MTDETLSTWNIILCEISLKRKIRYEAICKYFGRNIEGPLTNIYWKQNKYRISYITGFVLMMY